MFDPVSCEKYAQAAHRFLLSKSVHGIDFRTRNLVGVGHSLGGGGNVCAF